LICAKFGKDLFNISKVIGREKWPIFLTHSVQESLANASATAVCVWRLCFCRLTVVWRLL